MRAVIRVLLLEDVPWWLERRNELEDALRFAHAGERWPPSGPIPIGEGRARVERDDLERYSQQEDVLVIVRPGWWAQHLDELLAGLVGVTQEREEPGLDLDAPREQPELSPEAERERDREHGIER